MNSPFDKVYPSEEPKEQVVESRLSILVRHYPIKTPTMIEAYFEIEKRTKNIIKEVFSEMNIDVPKEVSVMF